jgi:hypothetical protein
MASIYDFLPPGSREQAGYAGLGALAQALLAGGAPTTTPGGGIAAMGQGLGGFGQAYNQRLMSGLQQAAMAQQMGRAQKEDEREQARLAAIDQFFTPPPVQMAMAGGPRPGPTPQAAQAAQPPVAQMFPGANVDALRAFARASPEAFLSTVGNRMMPAERKPLVLKEGEAAYDPATLKPLLERQPKAPAPGEFERALVAAGLEPGSPAYQAAARAYVDRKGQAPQTSVKVENVGSIPAGFQLVRGENGALRMEKIEGSPVAEAERKTQQQQSQAGNLVVQDIDRAQQIIEKSMLPTTGVVGGWLSRIGGTDARDLRGLLDTVRANAGFKELQAMRDSSPTGGALGQVTERELALLQAVVGNLEQDQSKEQLVDNMRRVKNVYLDIIHGPGNGPARAKLKFAEPEQKADGWQEIDGVRIRRKP